VPEDAPSRSTTIKERQMLPLAAEFDRLKAKALA
jgi:hypothetical protein